MCVSSTHSPSPFDFGTWLRLADPSQRWDIEPLTGGLVNVTIRARRRAAAVPSVFCRETLILKYAPPFVAALGESAPFSTFRQVIESRALLLLENIFKSSGDVRVPRLIVFDDSAHVLVIEDLGDDLVDLSQWLASNPAEDGAVSLGERLGAFFAVLHTSAAVLPDDNSFESPDSVKLISCQLVETVRNHLNDNGIPDADKLSDVVKDAHASSSLPYNKYVFSVGDLWPGSVLVSPDGQHIAVIDFEFAGPGRPLADLAQLGTHLHMTLLSTAAGSSLALSVSAFARSLHTIYRSCSTACNASWTRDDEWTYEIVRLAWILHGRELINNACEDFGPKTKKSEESALLTKRAVELGAWYIRACGDPARGVDSEARLKETFLCSLLPIDGTFVHLSGDKHIAAPN